MVWYVSQGSQTIPLLQCITTYTVLHAMVNCVENGGSKCGTVIWTNIMVIEQPMRRLHLNNYAAEVVNFCGWYMQKIVVLRKIFERQWLRYLKK